MARKQAAKSGAKGGGRGGGGRDGCRGRNGGSRGGSGGSRGSAGRTGGGGVEAEGGDGGGHAGDAEGEGGTAVQLATSQRGLVRELEKLGCGRKLSTVQKWMQHSTWRWGKPAPGNPIDPREVAEWARFRQADRARQAEQQAAQPRSPKGGGRTAELPPPSVEDNPDPFAPPPDDQILALRRHDPERWAEFLRKMRAAQAEGIRLEAERGRYIDAQAAADKRVAIATAVRTALKRSAHSLAGSLAQEDDPHRVEELLLDTFRRICSRALGGEGEEKP